MSASSSSNFGEMQPSKRRLCIGSSDHLTALECDFIPKQVLYYLAGLPELRRKRIAGHMENDFKKTGSLKGKNDYQMCLNVLQFKPSEISVKIKGEYIIVECEHKEKEDEYGSMYRHFVKRFKLPEEYCIDNLTSSLSSDGILIIRAPKKVSTDSIERIVQIQQTGPAHLNVTEVS